MVAARGAHEGRVRNRSPLVIRGSVGAPSLPVVDDKREVRSGVAMGKVVSADCRRVGVSL
jgi:hypothetical protein